MLLALISWRWIQSTVRPNLHNVFAPQSFSWHYINFKKWIELTDKSLPRSGCRGEIRCFERARRYGLFLCPGFARQECYDAVPVESPVGKKSRLLSPCVEFDCVLLGEREKETYLQTLLRQVVYTFPRNVLLNSSPKSLAWPQFYFFPK